jgi:tripartite-type tricarboxylate transporter receptor subunit TctC
MTHIPYRGAGPALNDTVAGQVPIIFDNMPSALPSLAGARPGGGRSAAPGGVAERADLQEVGLEPVNRMAYYGVLGPKGLSKDVVDKVAAAVKKTAELPEVRKRIEDTGSLMILNTPEQFAAQIKAEFDVYKKVVEAQKLTLE